MPNQSKPSKWVRAPRTWLAAGVALLLFILGWVPSWFGRSHWVELLQTTAPPLAASTAEISNAANTVRIHFIDVGQGDSILLTSGAQAVLIDGGERGNESMVIAYLKRQGLTQLSVVIATHPHSDHIGGLAYGVLDAFKVGKVIMPRLSQANTPTTQTYTRFLQAVQRAVQTNGTAARYAVPGQSFALGTATLTILAPLTEDPTEQNNNSVVLQLSHGQSRALFTGDAEAKAEAALIERWGTALQSQLLKAGHHGSRSSSTSDFLHIVQPKFLVASCGAGNSYGHPHPQTIAACKARGIALLRTDLAGSLVFVATTKQIKRITNP